MKYETGGVELDLFFLMVRLFLKYLDFSNFSTEILKKGHGISMKFIFKTHKNCYHDFCALSATWEFNGLKPIHSNIF